MSQATLELYVVTTLLRRSYCLIILFLFVCVVCMCIYNMHAITHGGPKRASKTLKLESKAELCLTCLSWVL